MKLINPSVEILEQSSRLNGIYEQIELAGRTCYKSEPEYNYYFTYNTTEISITGIIDPIIDGKDAIKVAEEKRLSGDKRYTRRSKTAKSFVDRMIKSGHGAMLEHGTVYLFLDRKPQNGDLDEYVYQEDFYNRYKNNKYSKIQCNIDGTFVTTNYRTIIENGWSDDLKYICDPTKYHEKRVTVKFVMDRIGSQSFCRHRVFSFAQESTRYCNYSKDKFGNELTFIKPTWYTGIDKTGSGKLVTSENNTEVELQSVLKEVERSYFTLLMEGLKPQEARAILPNCLKTELVMTGFTSDWNHFFELRCDRSAHPDAQYLANKLKDLMNEKK